MKSAGQRADARGARLVTRSRCAWAWGELGTSCFQCLILAVALVMAAEQLLANRFYASVGAASQAAIAESGRQGEAETRQKPIRGRISPSRPSPRLARRSVTAMNFELRFQPVVSLPVVVAVTAVLLGLLFVRPRHVQIIAAAVGGARSGLRLAVVLLMLFALLRPSFVYTKVEPVQASLVVLLDGSRSMQVADSLGDKSRWDAMKLLLDASAKDIAKLDKKLGRDRVRVR